MTEAPSTAQMKEEIAREIARVHEDSYGVPATRLEVAIEENFVAVLMDVGLTRGEETLVGAGSEDAVVASREAFQAAIGATFSAVVERATGRRVERFASRAIVDEGTPWACEIFRLGPAAGG
jgi:uncharacterized protein YbcI